MDTPELEARCLAILDDKSKPEDDKIELVEEFVRGHTAHLDESALERLILDILWAHRQGVKPQKPKIANFVNSKAVKLPPKPSGKKKFVPLDELEDQVELAAIRAESPYEMLQRLFGANSSEEDIDRLLVHNEFDIGRTVDMLLSSTQKFSDQELTAQRTVCKYFLAGNCMRGDDCMYSHDMSSKICRFWLQGKCILGQDCGFLHEVPDEVVQKLRFNDKPTKPAWPATAPAKFNNLPSLGSLPQIGSKKKRPTLTSSSIAADPAPSPRFDLSTIANNLPSTKNVNELVNRGRIPIKSPMRIPWDDTSYGPNAEYAELRSQAKKAGEARNKYLQMATDSWGSNDPASAKLLSKKGQMFNQSMVEAHRRAADLLYEYRTTPGSEIFIDLHGLELDEAVAHVEERIIETEETQGHNPRIAYLICGRGRYKVKRQADQLTQHVKAFLDRYGYLHKDFGENPVYGRIIGVDPWSWVYKPKEASQDPEATKDA